MKLKILLISILTTMSLTRIYSQTYYQGDVDALKSIDATCDGQNTLNWNTNSNPANWNGVSWSNDNPKRAVALYVNGMQLTGLLDLTALTRITWVYCYSNQLTGLNVSTLSNLVYLRCYENKITSLDVSFNKNLRELDCSYNQLTSLNVNGLDKVLTFHCESNQLTSLDVSTLTNLTILYCGSNQLTSLNVSGLTNLQSLHCQSNLLTNLNVSALTNLTELWCAINKLIRLDVSGLENLKELYCSNNELISLNVAGLTNLESLYCGYNHLTKLDMTGLSKLSNLLCYNNNLLYSSLVTGINASLFLYEPQGEIYSPIKINRNILLDYSTEALIKDSATRFVFYKDFNPVDTNNTGIYTTTGSGVYLCIMSNGRFPNLYLSTYFIYIDLSLNLSVSENSFEIGYTGDSVKSFDINSNTAWNVGSSEPWVTFVPISGSNKGVVNLNIGANPDTIRRSAIIAVSGEGVDTIFITLNQKAFEPIMTISSKSLNIGSEENSIANFNITSNTTWNVSSSEAWLTANPASGSNDGAVTLTAEANTAAISRTATVTVSGTGVTSQVITVTQAAMPTLSVSASTLTINYAANSAANFNITSNTTWSVSSSETWLTANPTSGSNDGAITLTAEANTAASSRSATITVSGTGVDTKEITVTQSGSTIIDGISQSVSNLVIYPNPVNNLLHVKQSKGKVLKIYDMMGTELLVKPVSQEIEIIDLSGWPTGLYILSTGSNQIKLLKK